MKPLSQPPLGGAVGVVGVVVEVVGEVVVVEVVEVGVVVVVEVVGIVVVVDVVGVVVVVEVVGDVVVDEPSAAVKAGQFTPISVPSEAAFL